MLPVISDPESLSTPADAADAAATDAVFDLLSDWRRRAVLRYLDRLENTDPVPLSDVADHVVLEDDGQDSGPLAATGDALLGTRKRIHISLRHTHVPKLADAGALEFDPETNTVALCETGEELVSQLQNERQGRGGDSGGDSDSDGDSDEDAVPEAMT
ncbi:uncharacterized protein Nmag_0031 [Natrialba magadii ATCC 43099]|uniref:DUF7344 domain-containing protein n=1 Tax=Natrialba magadii (strain ATCC 43099 / DSM 3394 / CCM 3739 / CIP 104546 / IAM 13178 / JCM 8861 / NBRC 102185 / NCIMB 2190 / MS3) TaxID=547559 RepID=D3SVR1_NATMM|nr:hypothetical protein [Natrialba magadii]ADD03630.1 uncharacterized protein Nmag_0031 [Natrialba magadii ATCC 43099]ELY34397.1 hypothetical protein C500_00642 [Natrialba magadii ATCC 43099]